MSNEAIELEQFQLHETLDIKQDVFTESNASGFTLSDLKNFPSVTELWFDDGF